MFKEKRLVSLGAITLAMILQGCGGGSGDSESPSEPTFAAITTLPQASSVTTSEDTMLSTALVTNSAPGVSYSITTLPSFGTASLVNSQYQYTPNQDFNGSDSFSYEVRHNGQTIQHRVTVTVQSVNDSPSFESENDTLTVAKSEAHTFSAAAVDVDNDELTYAIVTPPSSGTLTLNEQGEFTYTPTVGYLGDDIFTISVSDGFAEAVSGNVSVAVVEALGVTQSLPNHVVENNQATQASLSLTNYSQQSLSFTLDSEYIDVEEVVTSAKKGVAVNRSIPLKKGEKDNRKFDIQALDLGGPDTFGYQWIDSDEVNGPEFVWDDIQETGTLVDGLYDDSVSGPIAVGFDFPFYDSAYQNVYISSNGFISFSPDTFDGCCSGQPLPSDDYNNGLIAWMWMDLLPRAGRVHTQQETDRLIIQFTEYGAFSAGGTVTAQVILNSDGQIDIYYASFTEDLEMDNYSIGIENNDATSGLQVALNEDYLAPQKAISFFLPSSSKWLDLPSGEYVIEPAGTLDIPYRILGLNEPGNYSAKVIMTQQNNDASVHELTMTTEITPDITAPSSIEVAVSDVSFDSLLLTWPTQTDLGLDDTVLTQFDLRVNRDAINADNWATSTPVEGRLTLSDDEGTWSMAVEELDPSTLHHFAVVVTDDAENQSALQSDLSITTLSPPEASTDLDDLNLTLVQSESVSSTFSFQNTGEAVLEYEISLLPAVASGESGASTSTRITKPRKAPEKKSRILTALPPKGTYFENRLIVRFKSSSNVNNTAANSNPAPTAIGFNAQQVKQIPQLNMQVWELNSPEQMLNTIAQLMANPNVLSAEPDYKLYALDVPNDPLFEQLWGLNNVDSAGNDAGADVDAPETWNIISESPNVVVAVIDTGINYLHPDLQDNMWVNSGEVPDNGIDDDNNGFIDDVYGYDFVNNDGDPNDDNSHGTHVAGTIGAVGNNALGITGVTQDVQLMALKFLSSGGSGSSAGAIDSIIYAVDNGATILNNSWGGGPFDPNLLAAIEYANENGVLFVAAAGNSGSDNDVIVNYPSNYEVDNVVAVAAIDRNNALASFSQFGLTTVDLGAPGVDILSTVLNGYNSYNGTSMATPHVAGVAALVQGYSDDITVVELKSILLNSVEPLASLDGKTVTGGAVNAFNAINAAPPPWLSIDPELLRGSLAAGETAEITLYIDTANLSEEARYQRLIQISTNDPNRPIIEVIVTIVISPDLVAPSAVSDFALVEVSDTFAEVQFTASGDDGDNGTAVSYDLRFSNEMLTNDNWETAVQINGEPRPQSAGSVERFVVRGFSPNESYFVALRVIDNVGLASAISNNIELLTTSSGLVYGPLSFPVQELVAGEQAELTLSLENVGNADLAVSLDSTSSNLPSVESFFNESPLQSATINGSLFEKGAQLPSARGSIQAQSSGGSDNFGYFWIDSDEPNGPAFEWNDISATGTPVQNLSDDNFLGPFAIGFDFPFYEQSYDEFYISTNGFITFEDIGNSGCCSGLPLPNNDPFNAVIAWLWYDLVPGEIFYEINDQGSLVIQFENYGEYAGSGKIDAQVHLSPSGNIKLLYRDIRNDMRTDTASIGIENANSTDGLQVSFLQEYAKPELAVLISTSWLSVSNTTVNLVAGETQDINVSIDTTGLVAGEYSGQVRLVTNDPENPEVLLPINLVISENAVD